jgi:uncharacterized protein (DUF2147 family)
MTLFKNNFWQHLCHTFILAIDRRGSNPFALPMRKHLRNNRHEVDMNSKTILGAALISSMLGPLAAAAEPDINGQWAREDGIARVKIAPCGENLCATNIWVNDPSKAEAVGDRLVMTVKADSSSKLTGTAFDPKRDLNYSMTIKVSPSSLVTTGCIVGGLICKTVNWSRIGN